MIRCTLYGAFSLLVVQNTLGLLKNDRVVSENTSILLPVVESKNTENRIMNLEKKMEELWN